MSDPTPMSEIDWSAVHAALADLSENFSRTVAALEGSAASFVSLVNRLDSGQPCRQAGARGEA